MARTAQLTRTGEYGGTQRLTSLVDSEFKERVMHRRNFIRFAGAGIAASGALASSLHQPSIHQLTQTSLKKPDAARKALMKVGTQNSSSDEALAILAAFGVNHICSALPSARLDEQW